MDQEIAQFASITGAVPEIARYAFKEKKILIHSAYVESAGGDVQQAMTAYYEGDGAEHVASEAPVNEPPAPVARLHRLAFLHPWNRRLRARLSRMCTRSAAPGPAHQMLGPLLVALGSRAQAAS